MRRNYERVKTLQAELIADIKNWFVGKPDVIQIEFKRMFTIQVDVSNTLDDEYSVEYAVINYLTNDGFVIDNDGGEIELNELNNAELAFILDEIELNNINITTELE